MDDRQDTEVHVVLLPGASEAPTDLEAAASDYGARLRPQFEGSDDPTLSLFWIATLPVPDAERFIETVRALPDVDGAYEKPTDSPA